MQRLVTGGFPGLVDRTVGQSQPEDRLGVGDDGAARLSDLCAAGVEADRDWAVPVSLEVFTALGTYDDISTDTTDEAMWQLPVPLELSTSCARRGQGFTSECRVPRGSAGSLTLPMPTSS
jgi:hypothetical protein